MSVNHADGANVTNTEILAVPLHHIVSVINKLDKQIEDKDTLISFEFIIASLFPTVMDRITDYGTKKFIEGYNSHE